MMIVELLDGEVVRLSGFSQEDAVRIMITSYGDEIVFMQWFSRTTWMLNEEMIPRDQS